MIEENSNQSNNLNKTRQLHPLQWGLIMLALFLLGVIISPIIISPTLVEKNKEKPAINLSSQTESTQAIRWGDVGLGLVNNGVIDIKKLSAYNYDISSGSILNELLYKDDNKFIKIDSKNAGDLLLALWAFGLANKNPILEEGPMQYPEYGGPARFASTGGWVLAEGDAMKHYSRHKFILLSYEQQKLVERMSKNIYRPCCNNSTYFPDCNHGMAMLGLLELMASQGMDEEKMYENALQVNSYWFPDVYTTINNFLMEQGLTGSELSAKDILGSNYSSAYGFNGVLASMESPQPSGGAGCSI